MWCLRTTHRLCCTRNCNNSAFRCNAAQPAERPWPIRFAFRRLLHPTRASSRQQHTSRTRTNASAHACAHLQARTSNQRMRSPSRSRLWLRPIRFDARPQEIPADRASRLLDLPRAHPAAPAGTLHPPNARHGHWPQRFKQGRVTRLSRPARSVPSGWLASAYLGSRKPPNPIGATKGCLTIGIADALVSAMLWRKHRRSSQLAPVRVADGCTVADWIGRVGVRGVGPPPLAQLASVGGRDSRRLLWLRLLCPRVASGGWLYCIAAVLSANVLRWTVIALSVVSAVALSVSTA